MFKLFSVFNKKSAWHAAPAAAPASASPAESPISEEEKWKRMRAPQFAHERVLSGWTHSWLQSLPEAVRPLELSVRHPHVVNRLALCWNDPALTERLLDDLLIGRRGKRKGFPKPVAEELLQLRRYHDHYRSVDVQATVWECSSPG